MASHNWKSWAHVNIQVSVKLNYFIAKMDETFLLDLNIENQGVILIK